ncbi:hypothetical protein COCNU_04G015160 [Cocos nucifera]|uniref:Uncharacterized protein n=1 Tax=Cocos nucifera TaxID=13894 RepID=A0A8K0I784_COCNU|nr:hypothetical protein COCNU_04G015160 [Cocos nucifera]
MKGKAVALTFAERIRNIVTANWQAQLNTIKVDAKGSKDDIYSSKIHYMFKKGKPYIWIREGDLHNMNVIIDERASLSVSSIIPGPLIGLLRSIRKPPVRVALAGDIRPLKDDKPPVRVALAGDIRPLKDDKSIGTQIPVLFAKNSVKAQIVTESLAESVMSEYETISQASYSVSAILSSASASSRSRSENLQEILNESSNYNVYKFNIRSCTYIDGSGDTHDVEPEDIEAPKADMLLPFSEKIIDGINQSPARRRALMLFCFEYYNATARDALMLSIDRNGFDVLAKVPETITSSGLSQQYGWKEFRFTFKEAAPDIEAFCHLLVELEEEALQSVKSYTGLGFVELLLDSNPLHPAKFFPDIELVTMLNSS